MIAAVSGGAAGELITVEDPDDPQVVLRFIPETGNTGTGGGAYLLLDACPGCSSAPVWRSKCWPRACWWCSV